MAPPYTRCLAKGLNYKLLEKFCRSDVLARAAEVWSTTEFTQFTPFYVGRMKWWSLYNAIHAAAV